MKKIAIIEKLKKKLKYFFPWPGNERGLLAWKLALETARPVVFFDKHRWRSCRNKIFYEMQLSLLIMDKTI